MSEIQRLRQIVTQLRAPDGCPWDREQTHHSLLRCLVEEVSEVLEAVDNNDFELMEEELGDLLLQVVMHACLAEEQNRFDFEDVARGISDKLIRRHPHVFGDSKSKVDSKLVQPVLLSILLGEKYNIRLLFIEYLTLKLDICSM